MLIFEQKNRYEIGMYDFGGDANYYSEYCKFDWYGCLTDGDIDVNHTIRVVRRR